MQCISISKQTSEISCVCCVKLFSLNQSIQDIKTNAHVFMSTRQSLDTPLRVVVCLAERAAEEAQHDEQKTREHGKRAVESVVTQRMALWGRGRD